MRLFLGLANYYRNFLPQFARISNPLHDLTQKGFPNKLKWSQLAIDSFNNVKLALSQNVKLGFWKQDEPIILQTDASSDAIGACIG